MNLAGDLLIVEERLERQRRAGMRSGERMPAVPPVPAVPIEVIACKRITIDRVRYEPGQSLTLGGVLLRDLLEKEEVWIPTSADWWNPAGRVLMAEPGAHAPVAIAPTAGALRIAMGCAYDPGNAVYRYHSAINEHTKHSCHYLHAQKSRFSNPFQCPQQHAIHANKNAARAFVHGADVLHHHVNYYLGDAGLGPRARREQLIIRHYHGSMPGGPAKQHPITNRVQDDALGAVLLGARLTLCALRPDRMQWLPIPVPVARYAAMRPAERRPGPFRIAHSPTKAEYKGTQVFLDVCDRLNRRGVAVEPVLIGMTRTLEPDRKSHAEALRMKADCDAVFDSFWLGIQGSGLEGASMGLPVIAGDPDVRDLYAEHTLDIGGCPYTYANDGEALEHEIELLAIDAEYRGHEAWRVNQYVLKYHDYPRVAARYEEILAKALGRQDVRTT